MTLKLSINGARDIRLHEGFVAKAYRDPIGILTIGVGFTWGSTSFRQWWASHKKSAFGPTSSMTRDEADSCLTFLADTEYGPTVNGFLQKNVGQNVFDAMTSVVYNCGPVALRWSWAALIKAGQVVDGAERLKTTAITADGKKLAGLVARRKDEATLITKGVYASGGIVVPTMPEDHAMSDGILELYERGEPVLALQQKLASAGFYTGSVDAIFGRGTEAAVLAFQRSKGLVADGKAGPKTLAALGA